MKHQISTSVTINADRETVWNIFNNFSAYPEWNPFIKSITGPLEVGKKFRAELGNMKFKPVLKAYRINEEFTWLGHLIVPGIFDGRHSFTFTENADGTTTVVQKEDFSGILVRLLKKKLDTEIKEGFEAMNNKLKERAESLKQKEE